MSADQPTQRLFIGGATSQQSWESLQQRLGLFGKVLTVEHPAPKPTARPFMYVEFAPNSQQDLHKCITTVCVLDAVCQVSVSQIDRLPYHHHPQHTQLNGTKWQGATLRIERAQTSYLSKLQTAWEEDAAGGEAAEGGDDDNGIPPATYPLRISRPRKRHKVCGGGYLHLSSRKLLLCKSTCVRIRSPTYIDTHTHSHALTHTHTHQKHAATVNH